MTELDLVPAITMLAQSDKLNAIIPSGMKVRCIKISPIVSGIIVCEALLDIYGVATVKYLLLTSACQKTPKPNKKTKGCA